MERKQEEVSAQRWEEEQARCSYGEFMRASAKESKKLWSLAGPAIFTAVTQYSLEAITQVYAGHLTTLELNAVATVNLVVASFAFGVMMGMGSALETLCGQAFGAKQLHLLGIYLQRSWIILALSAIFILPIYLWASPLLRLVGDDREIADLSGTFALYMIPQLFAYAFNFPIQKFLQAQSKVLVIACTYAAALALHVPLSWLLIVRLRMRLVGAALSLNLAWWLSGTGQLVYIMSGKCKGAWTGFSWTAFKNLLAFAKLSLGSGIMLCLEVWYYMFLVILAGRMRNAQVSVAAFSICGNLSLWVSMVFMGFNAAISVRVSNELGARRPKAARFAMLVMVTTSCTIGLVFFMFVLRLKHVYGLPFTNSSEVARTVSSLAIFLALTLLLNSVQTVLTGVAVGAGWQWLVAYVNIGCYYFVGLPLGFLLGCYYHSGLKGIWSGMLAGVILQTLILAGIIFRTNWESEATIASSRIKKWGGSDENLATAVHTHESIEDI